MSNANILIMFPRELQHYILSFLSVKDWLRLSETCHGLKDLVRDPALWKKVVFNYVEIKNNTKACRDHVARCSSLKELCIKEEEMDRINSDKIMSVVMKAKSTLKTLSMDFLKLSNASFKKISQMTQLSKLEVRWSKIKSDGIASLANLSELKSLTLNAVHRGGDITSKDLVDFFSRIKKLEEVEIRFHNLNDEVIESIVVNNPNLRHLVINCNFMTNLTFTGRSLGIIADNCPQLDHIDIGYSNIQNDDIMQLVSGCSKLNYANFECTRIEDSALARLARDCPDLETLKLSGCSEITGQGIEAFLDKVAEGKLKHLDNRDCDFHLNVKNLKIPERLKEEHPNIEIIC